MSTVLALNKYFWNKRREKSGKKGGEEEMKER